MGSRQFHECDRCDREFRSLTAIRQHLLNSSRHHVCLICRDDDYDFEHADELDDHLKEDHHYCIPCKKGFDSNWGLEQHDINMHNLCVTCGRYFKSPSNLDNHKITHAAKDVDCPGCNRQFVNNSAMVLHLEAGTCPSEVDNYTVHELASECHQWQYYHCDMPEYDYECPTCETSFRYMSALLQHVENGSCDEDLSWQSPLAIFLRFIRARI